MKHHHWQQNKETNLEKVIRSSCSRNNPHDEWNNHKNQSSEKMDQQNHILEKW